MRILIISNFYPPLELGGYSQWCQEVSNALQARGHQIHVLTSCHLADTLDENKNRSEANISRVLKLQAPLDYYKPLDFFINRRVQERENYQLLEEMINGYQPDLIFVWGMWNLTHNIPYWAEKLMPGRVAYFISSYWPQDIDPHIAYWQLPANRPLTNLVKKPFQKLAQGLLKRENYPPRLQFNHAVCCSRYVRDTLKKAGKLPETAGVLYGGIDPEPLVQDVTSRKLNADQKVKLLYFGRLIHDKGVHTAIEAVGKLKHRGFGDLLELTILGDGHPAYKKELRGQVDVLDLSAQVKFVDKVERNQIPEWLKRFDVFLFTSIWPEPMARSVMEAMAAGLLVIGSDVGGQVEIFSDGHNALTFPVEDADKLSMHIETITRNPEFRMKLARAGQKDVLNYFTLERMVTEIETFLSKIIYAN